MEYRIIVQDFAYRTRKNLDLLRILQAEDPEVEIYEVTQLVNSLLGLLIFPQQSYIDEIPHIPLQELKEDGWPIPRIIGEYPQVKNLNQLVRYLRNAIAHFNVHFLVDDHRQLTGIQVWNEREQRIAGGKKEKHVVWKAEISLLELELITNKFIDLLLEKNQAG